MPAEASPVFTVRGSVVLQKYKLRLNECWDWVKTVSYKHVDEATLSGMARAD